MLVDDEIELPVQINGKVKTNIIVGANDTNEMILQKAKKDVVVKSSIDGKQIVKEIYVPKKIINIVVK